MSTDSARTPCEYCGKLVGGFGRHMHVRACVHRPGVIEAVRTLMDPDGTGKGMSCNRYDDARAQCGERLPSSDALQRQCGPWSAVMELLGQEKPAYTLTPRGAAWRGEDVAIAAAAEETRRAREAMHEDHGLPVCRVYETRHEMVYVLR